MECKDGGAEIAHHKVYPKRWLICWRRGEVQDLDGDGTRAVLRHMLMVRIRGPENSSSPDGKHKFAAVVDRLGAGAES